MYPYKASPRPSIADTVPRDAELRIAVTFKGRSNSGPTKVAARLSSASIGSFAPMPGEKERAIEALRKQGFTISGTGKMTVSMRGTAARPLLRSTRTNAARRPACITRPRARPGIPIRPWPV